MRMDIVLIFLISINGINCLKNGIPVDSNQNDANSVVTIRQYESTTPQYLCSGNIITESHIITAGHCVHNVKYYEIYVTTGRIDRNDEMSVMVQNIYLHHNFKKVYNPDKPLMEYWLNDIAILDLVYKLTWGIHIKPISLSFRELIHTVSDECYIIGWNYRPIDTMISLMTLEWADILILGDSCHGGNAFLLPNEIYGFLTATRASVDDMDIGTSLICNNSGVGIIVGGRDRTRSVATVLTLAPYQFFIEYISARGVAEIEEEEFRDVAAIWKSGRFRCGGFMIYDRYIVTAAHCVEDAEKQQLLVAFPHAKTHIIEAVSVFLSVESIEIHPLYRVDHNQNWGEHSLENDIAVLKVKSNHLRSSSIHSMDFPDSSRMSAAIPYEILRWTHQSSRNTPARILKKSFVTILSSETEEESGFHLGAEQFRAKGLYGLPFATNEDIGNPIIFENNIIGMVVAVNPSVMGTVDPVTCLKIYPYRDFILNAMRRT